MRLVLFCLWTLAASADALAQRVLFVDDDAATGGDGTSWQSAFRSLQVALAQSQAGDSVFVAEGRYTPDDGAGMTKGDRTLSFRVKPGVSLFGGFRGTEAYSSERVFGEDYLAVHPSVLSGDLLANDADSLYHDAPFLADNARIVLRVDFDEGLIDGFNVSGASASDNRAAGVLAGGEQTRLRHLHITRNAGVGLRASARTSYIVVDKSVLDYNVSRGLGGGAEAHGVDFRDVVFAHNRIVAEDGRGGGLYTYQASLLRVQFVGNSVTSSGGGFYLTTDLGPPTITMVDVVFEDNVAAYEGSAFTCTEVRALRMANVLIKGNRTTTAASSIEGGTVSLFGCSLDLYHATFLDNRAAIGGEVATVSSAFPVAPSPRMTSIVQQSTSGAGGDAFSYPLGDTASVTLSYSVLSAKADTVEAAYFTAFDVSPQLTPDGTPASSSPAIDRVPVAMLPADWLDVDMDGDTTEALPLDLLGNPRVVGEAADAGAIEKQQVVSAASQDDATGVEVNLYPRPARESVTLHYMLSAFGHVRVEVFDALGRRVAVLADGPHRRGPHQAILDTRGLSSGVYLYRVSMEGRTRTGVLTVAR